MSIEVMLLTKVTVENWTMVNVVGVAVVTRVETDVIVSVDDTVSCKVVGVVLVSVVVVTWMGTKRVDWVTEVRTVDMDTVVKSVTTVGTMRVGISPFITMALSADWRVTALWLLELDSTYLRPEEFSINAKDDANNNRFEDNFIWWRVLEGGKTKRNYRFPLLIPPSNPLPSILYPASANLKHDN